MSGDSFHLSRRQLFGSSALASLGVLGATAASSIAAPSAGATASAGEVVAFHGEHQAGIATDPQDFLAFATFDVGDVSPSELKATLDQWSAAAATLAAGDEIAGPANSVYPPADTGEALGRGPARLSVTIGYGPSLFRGSLGLASSRPAALVELPPFPGDQLDPAISDGDIVIQACADDPQVAFHAVHTLARIGLGTIALRTVQMGFGRTSITSDAQETQRNLLGFKDGTENILAGQTGAFDDFVWVGDDADQDWMRGGSYLVYRRIRMRLELWNATSLNQQQQAIGRFKVSGAPLTGTAEFDKPDFASTGIHGQPVIPYGAHIRVASPSANGGVRILRRGYGFADGIDSTTGELDAGLAFICFQKDPTKQFVAIQNRLAVDDTLASYLEHTASGIFACPGGTSEGHGWGTTLLG